MRVLLDTNSLLWATNATIDTTSAALIDDETNTILYSTVSIWEIVIKKALKRQDFNLDVGELLEALRGGGYRTLDILEDHILTVGLLPDIHKDPFDRLLVAQAQFEKMTLLTSDDTVTRYGISTKRSRLKSKN